MTALMGLLARLRLARLYLCTDARSREGDLGDFLRAAFAGGVDIVQINPVGLDARRAREAFSVAREAARPHQGVVCLAGSPALAGELAADMLHLNSAEESAQAARRPLHRWALLGRTADSPGAIDAAAADPDLDYFFVGPVPGSRALVASQDATPVDDPAGRTAAVAHAARVAPCADVAVKPWFAVGGVSLDTVDRALDAGARRVAVGRAVTAAADPQASAAALSARLRQAWRDDPAMEFYAFAALAP